MRKIILLFLLFLTACAVQEPREFQTTPEVADNPQQEIVPVEQAAPEVRAEQAVPGYRGELIAGSVTPYLRYNKADFEKAKQEGKAVYLYFYATWCPICRLERPSIFRAFNEMNYDHVIGFEVHFNDDSTTKEDEDLAREFGVTYQHTTIILDKTGKGSYRSLSKIDKDTILAEIAKVA